MISFQEPAPGAASATHRRGRRLKDLLPLLLRLMGRGGAERPGQPDKGQLAQQAAAALGRAREMQQQLEGLEKEVATLTAGARNGGQPWQELEKEEVLIALR